MATNGGLNAINETIPELHGTIISQPWFAKSFISIIAFSDIAEVLLEATWVTEVDSLPGVSDDAAQRGTSDRCFGAALTTLRHAIRNDAQNAELLGYRIYPIYAFFIVGGEPTDDGIWQLQLEKLREDPSSPRLVAFGIEQASLETVRAVGPFASSNDNEGKSPAHLLQWVLNLVDDEVIRLGADLDSSGSSLDSI